MHVNWVTLALQLINFAVLVWLLQRFLYRPVLRIIDARRAAIAQQLSAAAGARTQADEQLAALQGQRSGVAAERTALLRTAAADADRLVAARREQAEHAAAELLDQARATVERERREAFEAARRAAFDLGADIAARLLQEVPEPLRTQAWLERIEQYLDSLPQWQRTALLHELGPDAALTVVTATPLTAGQLDSWHTRIGHALASGLRITFEADPKLIAGAQLHFGGTDLVFTLHGALQALRAGLEPDAHHP